MERRREAGGGARNRLFARCFSRSPCRREDAVERFSAASCPLVLGGRDLEHRQKRCLGLQTPVPYGGKEGCRAGGVGGRKFFLETSVMGSFPGMDGREGASVAQAGTGKGAQVALESDFKEKKPDSEAVVMLQWWGKLERGDWKASEPACWASLCPGAGCQV